MAVKILSIGSAYLDINCSDFPFSKSGILSEKEVVGKTYKLEPGGSAVNFARCAASLGLDAMFIGKVGDDVAGKLLAGQLEACGLQPSLILDKTVSTNLGINFINPLTQTIMTVVGTANQSLKSDEVIAKATPLLPQLDYLYIGGCFKLDPHLLFAFTELATAAKTVGVKVIIDHARLTPGASTEQIQLVKSIVSQADYYFPSRDEFLELWQVGSIEAGLRLLHSQTSALVIVKADTEGVFALETDALIQVAAFQVKLLHVVGAGDSFNAGFIAAQEQGLNLQDSMEFACATAALKISQSDLPTLSKIHALIASKRSK